MSNINFSAVVTTDDRIHAQEILATSPELENGMTAIDWLADHGDPFSRRAAKLIKILGAEA